MARRQQSAFLGALATVAALPLIWVAAVHVSAAHWLDAAVLNGFTGLDRGRIHPLARTIAHICDPKPFVWLAGALVVIALVRRRPRVALAVAVVLGGANVTTQLLKPALATPRVSSLLDEVGQVGAASWPSGHATAAMSLALCAVLVAAPRWRPRVAALGGAFAVAVSFSFLTLDWHYPSDVLGGFLVAATWTLAAVGAVWWAEERWPTRGPAATARATGPGGAPPLGETLAPAALAALTAVALGGVVLAARPEQVVTYAHGHTAFVVGALAIGALALALAAGVAVVLRAAPPRRRAPS